MNKKRTINNWTQVMFELSGSTLFAIIIHLLLFNRVYESVIILVVLIHMAYLSGKLIWANIKEVSKNGD